MLLLSIIFHVGIFFVTLLLPQSMPGAGRFQGIVYEVDLVEMPAGTGQRLKGTTPATAEKEKSPLKEAEKAKRVSIPKKKEKPVVIAKQTVKKKKPPAKKKAESTKDLIEKAISKIEKKVQSDTKERTHIDKAISKLEDKVAGEGQEGEGEATGRPGSPGGTIGNGIHLRMYQMEVEIWIKSNWAYPVALQRPKNLEAIVVLRVKRDGSITRTDFKKRSSDTIFDQSVTKAIERSDPLPPLPEGYVKSYEELEITFNLKELENH